MDSGPALMISLKIKTTLKSHMILTAANTLGCQTRNWTAGGGVQAR